MLDDDLLFEFPPESILKKKKSRSMLSLKDSNFKELHVVFIAT